MVKHWIDKAMHRRVRRSMPRQNDYLKERFRLFNQAIANLSCQDQCDAL